MICSQLAVVHFTFAEDPLDAFGGDVGEVGARDPSDAFGGDVGEVGERDPLDAFGGDGSEVGERESPSGGGSVTIKNPLKATSITDLFMDLIEVVLVFATPLIVFFIIYAGFLYVTARGNPEQISQANKALLYSVIGGILILGAFVILRVIEGTVKAITI